MITARTGAPTGKTARKHFILTTLTAYAPWKSPRTDPYEGTRSAQIGRNRKQLKAFLATKKRLPGTSIDLQPILVSFRKKSYASGSWSYEHGAGDDDSFIGHMDSLYEVTLDAEGATEAVHRLIDSIHAARAVIDRQINDEIAAIPVHPRWIPAGRTMLVSDLKERAEVTKHHPSIARDYFDQLFSSRTGSLGPGDSETWRLAPLFIRDERLLYAAMFLKASLHEYMFLGDDIEEAILKNEAPLFVHDAVRAENAVHNAYKVIEAIWGGNLPDDRGKIERGLREKGIDPLAMVGYAHHGIHAKEHLVAKVLKLRDARNEKTAHGRIRAGRKNTYYEIMDYQALARAALNEHIRHVAPECCAPAFLARR